MTPPLFLVQEAPSADEFVLGGEEGRHAARVKRLAVGEPILISDGRGVLLECEVSAVLADGLSLAVVSRRRVPAPEPRLVVVQALPKGERAELAVELMTELGADEIVPWAASRCIAQWHGARGEKALHKWRRTAREAAKQSRRARVPRMAPLASSAEIAQRLGGGLVLHEGAAETLASIDLPLAGDLVVVVGPEGGITPDELDLFAAQGARTVRMGDSVLRTSTAGGAALAALSLRLGRWGRLAQ